MMNYLNKSFKFRFDYHNILKLNGHFLNVKQSV